MAGAIGDTKNVDLNSASKEELERVGGLGRERAERIAENRPFKSWDDPKRVEGFSDKLIRRPQSGRRHSRRQPVGEGQG